jgi:hypothetical protein
MSTIELKFVGLRGDQAAALLAAYEQITAGAVAVQTREAPAPLGAMPAPSNGDPFVANVPARLPSNAVADVNAPAREPAPTGPGSAYGHPTAAPGTEVDAFGVPYNPALHSVTTGPSKGRNQDGSWKMKKNVKREEFDAWARTHRAAAASPTPAPAAAPTPANLNAQFGAPPVQNGDPFAGAVAPGQAFGSPPPAPPALPAVPYEQFVALCNDMMLAGKLATSVIASVKREIGCEDEQKINNDPETRARAFAVLTRINTTGA